MAEPVETGPRSEGAGGGTGPSHSAAPSGRLDLDASPLRTGRLGDANREHTVVELCVDAFRVDLARKHDPELELADPARTSADDAFALALLDLAADRQLVAGNLDVHVFAVDPRHFGLDDVGVLQLLDVDRRDPSRRLVEHAPEGLIEHPPHTFVQLAELAQRAPVLGSGPIAFRKKLRHLAISFHSVSISRFCRSGRGGALGNAWTPEARRAVAVVGPRLGYFSRVEVTPFRQRDQGLRHRPPERCERILDPDRDLGEDSPRDETVALECAQRVGHDLLGHAREAREQAAVTAHAARHEEQEVYLPLALQDVERLVDALDQVEVAAARPRHLGQVGLAKNCDPVVTDGGHASPLSQSVTEPVRLRQAKHPTVTGVVASVTSLVMSQAGASGFVRLLQTGRWNLRVLASRRA